MTRWLDPLGWLKWPSLLLIASPIAAYPFWQPAPEPALDCGRVRMDGRVLHVFKAADGSAFFLRPTAAQHAAAIIPPVEPAGFDNGGVRVEPGTLALQRLTCEERGQPAA